MRATSIVSAALAVSVVIVALLATTPRAAQVPLDPAALVAQLQATTGAWDRADLEGFIAPYAAESTYMTADGPIGRKAMKAHYQAKYFTKDARPRPLRFEQTTVRALGDGHALMTGRFVLGGDGKPDQSGWFTLVWVRTPAGWRILHDHSS